MADFDGKTVVITGAGRGIGRRLAVDFAAAGARVVVNYAVSADGARDAVGEIAAAGGEAIAYRADVADGAAVNAMFDAALEAFGSIDVLVNNAGLNIDKPFLELGEDDLLPPGAACPRCGGLVRATVVRRPSTAASTRRSGRGRGGRCVARGCLWHDGRASCRSSRVGHGPSW